MKHITIKRTDNTVALEGNYTDLCEALDELKKKEHGTFTAYRTCPIDEHLVHLGIFEI